MRQAGSPTQKPKRHARAQAAAHQAELAALQRQRDAAIAKWRASTGSPLPKPEEHRDSSPRVDLFGTLRGACARTDCRAWSRDIASMRHWSDTTVARSRSSVGALCPKRCRAAALVG